MPFEKGQSGNPAGRPKGITRASKLVEMLEPDAPELVKKIKNLALAGDTTALKICLERLYPQTRIRDELIELPELIADQGLTLTEQSDVIITALAEGVLTISEASTAIQTITAQAKIMETDELIKRIEILEKGQSE